MKHMWVLFLCLTIIIKLAYSQNHECVNERKWQIGYTMYENNWHGDKLYVYARCNDSSHVLPPGANWNLCERGKLERDLPRCQQISEVFFKCEVGKRWQDRFTKYEVISHGAALYVLAACTKEEFIIDRAASSIRCDNSISNRVLPQCRKGEVKNHFEACATGRRSRSDDYEFENVWRHGSLYVRVICIHEGIETSSDTILCENGKMIRRPPIDFCKIQEDGDRACVLGKKWTTNDTEYEIRAIIKNKFMVTGKCIVPGFHIGRSSRKLCRSGRIPEELPQCNVVDLNSSTISPGSQVVHTTNGNISHTTDEEIGSSGRNKCRVENGGCSQICNYEKRRVQCFCHKEYELQNDNKTCAEKRDEDACFSGRKWTANDTEYEILRYGYDFMVLIICKDPSVFRVIGERLKLCEQGRIPSELPQCKVVNLPPRTTSTVTNKCYLVNGGCDHTCNKLNGTVQCSCNEGYELHWDNKTCIDLNECLSQNFGCSDKCVNTPGSSFCSCPVGFTLQSDRKQCTDIDECASNTTNKCHHQCMNTEGSYKCSCHPGYVLINDFKCEVKSLLDACAIVRRSRNDDYEFEYVWHHGTLHVRVFCIHEGIETRSETIPCENGKMKRAPPIDFCYEPHFWK